MASLYRYYVHQDFTSDQDSFPSEPHINLFNIELRFTHLFQLSYPETLEIPDFTRNEAFVIPRDRLLSDQEGPRIIALLLSSGWSTSEFLEIAVPHIFGFAREMERNPSNINQRILTMVINLSVLTSYDGRVISQSYVGAVVPKFRAASKESIEKYLQKVKFQDLEQSTRQQQCTVCLEEFDDVSDDIEIVRMPCGHVYHEKCIVKWLERSHLCPLCRYEIPF